MRLPDHDDVLAAARRIEGVAHRTPVLTSRSVDEVVGARVHFKAENLQRVGAFKFRGAFNALSRFDDEQRRRGVVTFSSGNHAQAIALASRLLDVPATIVMPEDAPSAKVAATAGYGARIIRYDRYRDDREAVAAELVERDGHTLIPPYDHPDIIAGQGTAVAELLADTDHLDALFVPLGGGGLLSGSLLSARALSPGTAVFGVEPAAGDDGRRSLAAGEIVRIPAPRTIADGAATTHLGTLTFPIIAEHVTELLVAEDDDLVDGVQTVATRMKQVIEPTAALGLAALIANRERWRGAQIGVVLSGGNVDLPPLISRR
ncbi:threo-3-hydroxy-L-aspartate ammonia-lyase [Williamsia sterculiae]|nr:threo-3-hydroxy-L-aspartate ammonia-lyase [Williamsia sterculiae]